MIQENVMPPSSGTNELGQSERPEKDAHGQRQGIERIPVHSSFVAEVGYDPATRTLEIELRRGSVYRYLDVPEAVFEGLLQAESVGGYFNKHIKNHYELARRQPAPLVLSQ